MDPIFRNACSVVYVRQAQNRAKTKDYQAYAKPKPPGTKKYQSEAFLTLFEWIDVNTTETCKAQIVKPKSTFRAWTESFRLHFEAQQGFLVERFNPALAREWRWERRMYRGTKRALYIEFKKDHPESIPALSEYLHPMANMEMSTSGFILHNS
ncbi:hypothetical protein BLNAU_4948 [Blattamonas nauphoetae]|uniref:Transposase n=1 Tax=Blattamonas nauphoetae TaxID=2049346 RepID=A0ABQ9Y8M8_9EUKA|nr:hypothetical protein BLNAU_4948 [Blattamonas nauphoetae]